MATISAEKSSHKHAGKLLKSGHELKESNVNLEGASKSPLPLHEESTGVKPAAAAGREGGRKHHRHGKNKKGGVAHHKQEQQQHQQQQQQQAGRSRKAHSKSKVNNNGPVKTPSKHGRKHGRGKQTQ